MIDLDTVTVAQLERDPYPIYAALRAEAPVAYMPCLDVWMVTRWVDVEAACVDPTAFPAHVERSPTDRALGGVSMMTTDGDPAKRRRRPFDPTLRPRTVEALMPDILARLCSERLAAMTAAGAFPPGARAILVVPWANRDRAIWGPSADDFDIARPRRGHQSFATGPHYCIGHHFACVQLQVAIRMLLERFPRWRLDPAHEVVCHGHEYRSPRAVRVLLD